MSDIKIQQPQPRAPIIDGVGRADRVFLNFLIQLRKKALATMELVDAPASASDTGSAGQVAYDADYFYICVDTDTWKRVGVSTW